jgi:nucleotide-binding universal stress UspA family protein
MASLAMSMDIAETLFSIVETGEGEGMSAVTSTSDLIALATHGRGAPARRVMGSVTDCMLDAT